MTKPISEILVARHKALFEVLHRIAFGEDKGPAWCPLAMEYIPEKDLSSSTICVTYGARGVAQACSIPFDVEFDRADADMLDEAWDDLKFFAGVFRSFVGSNTITHEKTRMSFSLQAWRRAEVPCPNRNTDPDSVVFIDTTKVAIHAEISYRLKVDQRRAPNLRLGQEVIDGQDDLRKFVVALASLCIQ